MARTARNDVDYFPHGVSHGKGMYYMENKYGNDGYATWFKILEALGKAEYHYLNLSDDIQMMYLASKCKVEEDVLVSMLNDLVRLGEFNRELWENNKVLWNQKFVDSIKDAYKKRTEEVPTIKIIYGIISGISDPETHQSDPEKEYPEVSTNSYSQRIVKDSKGKEIKEKDGRKEEDPASPFDFKKFWNKEVLPTYYPHKPNRHPTSKRFMAPVAHGISSPELKQEWLKKWQKILEPLNARLEEINKYEKEIAQ